MDEIRKIKQLTTGTPTVDGAGVNLVRVIGYHDTADYDPFLMLDAFDSKNPEDYVKGFPWHPHRGIETITYLVHGCIEHGDSLGNKGEINAGDCQWMTAGSGIIHQEFPKPSEWMLGAQLWLNLPAKDKMCEPHYGTIEKNDIPVFDEPGARIHVIAGEYKGKPGAFSGKYRQATYLDVELEPGSEWVLQTDANKMVFLYIMLGSGSFEPENGKQIPAKTAVLFEDGERIWAKAGAEGIRFLLMMAQPLHEPIAWGGPLVMNTKEELDLAFKELQEDRFLKHKIEI